MQNNWNVFDTDEVAVWESDLPLSLSGEELLAWQDAVLTAGERHSTLRVLAAPEWGYRRDRDGPVLDWLRRYGDRIEPMPPFPRGYLVGRIQRYSAAALLAYAGPDGIAQNWVSNLADFAVSLGLPWPGLDYPPLSIETMWEEDGIGVSIGTSTDIWFARNEARHRATPGPIDNRALARVNGPRLNGFLADVRSACRALGGTWTWDTVTTSYGFRELDAEGFVTCA